MMVARVIPRLVVILVTLVLAGVAGPLSAAKFDPASAKGRNDGIPPELRGVTILEKSNATLPLATAFVDETGAPVTLADYFEDGKPVILTFNYSNCPLLCGEQLGGLVRVLTQLSWAVGEQFHIVTIGLDPSEGHRRAFDSKENYLLRYRAAGGGREAADSGWHFLTGRETSIRAVADAVGFGYRYYEPRKEYLHPAALIVATPTGTVSGYLYGIKYEPKELLVALQAAQLGQLSEATQRIILSCFHYVAPTGLAAVAAKVMRYGGAIFVVGLGVAAWWVVPRRRAQRNKSVAMAGLASRPDERIPMTTGQPAVEDRFKV